MPPDSQNYILLFYNVFGFSPHTILGANILATSDEQHSYQVFVPDFIEGKPADIFWYWCFIASNLRYNQQRK
jgi:hypothetical protein